MTFLRKPITLWTLIVLAAFSFVAACSEEMSQDSAKCNTDAGGDINGDHPSGEGFDPQPEPDPRFIIRHLLRIDIIYLPQFGDGSQFLIQNESGTSVLLKPAEDGTLIGWIPAAPGESIDITVSTDVTPESGELYVVESDNTEPAPRESFVPCSHDCRFQILSPSPISKVDAPELVLYID